MTSGVLVHTKAPTARHSAPEATARRLSPPRQQLHLRCRRRLGPQQQRSFCRTLGGVGTAQQCQLQRGAQYPSSSGAGEVSTAMATVGCGGGVLARGGEDDIVFLLAQLLRPLSAGPQAMELHHTANHLCKAPPWLHTSLPLSHPLRPPLLSKRAVTAGSRGAR